MEYIEGRVLGLTLHLPTPWQQEDISPCFLDNQDHNIYRNPGRSANRLHKQFTDKMGEDTLKHIQSAVHLGANYKIHNGFKERNTAVARESEYLVAFTWNNGKTPKEESGTYDTWKKHRGTKIHIPIGSLPCVEGYKSISSFFKTGCEKPHASTAGGKGEVTGLSGDSPTDSGCCCGSSSESSQELSQASGLWQSCEQSESTSLSQESKGKTAGVKRQGTPSNSGPRKKLKQVYSHSL